jgi:hypothetical protein
LLQRRARKPNKFDIMNFKFDTDSLLGEVPILSKIKVPVLLLNGQLLAGTAHMQCPNISSSKETLTDPYSSHHSKLALIFYKRGVRFICVTGNFIPSDWTYKTNAVFVEDFPLEEASGRITGSSFESDLCDNMSHLDVGQRRSSDLENVKAKVMQYDFSAAEAIIVACVPGTHRFAHKYRWGIEKLDRCLSAIDITSPTQASQVMLISSIGSLRKEAGLLASYAAKMMSQRNGPSAPLRCRLQGVCPP